MAQVQVKTALKRKLNHPAPNVSTVEIAQQSNASQALEFAQQQSFKVVHTILHSSVCLTSSPLYSAVFLIDYVIVSLPRLPPVILILVVFCALAI